MKTFYQKRGFTLIELLVVIAIIGLLASMVLINLNSARTKAKNVAIRAALVEVRASAEISYDVSTPNSYNEVCAGSCLGTAQTLTQTGDFKRIDDNIAENGGGAVCVESATCDAYAVWSSLTGGSGAQWGWCVDSLGNSKYVSQPTTALTACP